MLVSTWTICRGHARFIGHWGPFADLKVDYINYIHATDDKTLFACFILYVYVPGIPLPFAGDLGEPAWLGM